MWLFRSVQSSNLNYDFALQVGEGSQRVQNRKADLRMMRHTLGCGDLLCGMYGCCACVWGVVKTPGPKSNEVMICLLSTERATNANPKLCSYTPSAHIPAGLGRCTLLGNGF